MATMTLRDVPDDLHAWRKQQVEAHHRSINKEVIALLDPQRTQAVRTPLAVEQRRTVIDQTSRHCSSLPVLGARTPDELIGYDENGIPG